jgi:hypothetical protein
MSVWMLHLHDSHFDPEHGKLSQYKLNPPFIFLSCLPFTIFFPFSVPLTPIYSGPMTKLVSGHPRLPAKELLTRHLCSALGLMMIKTLYCASSQF